MKNIKNNVKGITLVTLIITIVVLLILASIGTYSGAEVIKSSKFTKFTTEMKIMQTQVNQLYEKYKNGDNEILNLGKEVDTVQTQANTVFTHDASGITDKEGYRYFDQKTIQGLNIEGIEGEFFINIEKRSVVSYKGFKYEDVSYYTLEQIPNSLYNVDYENKNTEKPTFKVEAEKIEENKWKINISDIEYSGYINKWKVNYKLEGQNNWNTSKDYSFIVKESGKYIIQLVNGKIKSEEIEVIVNETQALLPSEYQQVEYIESTGTQYINTLVPPIYNDIFILEYSHSRTVNAYNSIMGAASDGNNERIYISDFSSSRFFGNVHFEKASIGEKYKYEFTLLEDEKSILKINNIEVVSSKLTVENLPMMLFARNSYNGKGIGKIYSFIWKRNNKDIYNFIPCYATTNITDVEGKECQKDTIGLYDTVEGKFYTNQGTGTFEKGADVN